MKYFVTVICCPLSELRTFDHNYSDVIQSLYVLLHLLLPSLPLLYIQIEPCVQRGRRFYQLTQIYPIFFFFFITVETLKFRSFFYSFVTVLITSLFPKLFRKRNMNVDYINVRFVIFYLNLFYNIQFLYQSRSLQ